MPTKPRADVQAFLQAITAEAEAVTRFVEILKLEQQALSNGTTENLINFAEQKDKLVVHLGNLAAQRNFSLEAQGLGTDRSGIEAWCTKNPGDKTAAKAWKDILSMTREARELNRLNGELIGIHMQHNSRALEILLRSRDSLNLYGPDGQAKTLGSNRINDAV